ncbi:MAG: hypothetical protein AAGI24_13290 [Pseudomonadota bacterium]
MYKSLALMSLTALLGCQAVADSYDVVSESLQMTEAQVPITRDDEYLVDLSIDISYLDEMTQSDYPDFIQLKKDLRTWADGYNWTPAEGEPMVGWETMVSDLSIEVIDNYPTIKFVALSASVYPSAGQPHALIYKSLALRPREASDAVNTQLSVVLPIVSYGIEQQGPNVIDLTTELQFAQAAGDYPPPSEVYAMLFELMENYPNETDFWETQLKAMSKDLLNTYSQLDAIDMTMRVYPTATVAYFHRIHCRTER